VGVRGSTLAISHASTGTSPVVSTPGEHQLSYQSCFHRDKPSGEPATTGLAPVER